MMGIEAFQVQSFPANTVYVGRISKFCRILVIITDITIAKVICQNENNIRLFLGIDKTRGNQAQHADSKRFLSHSHCLQMVDKINYYSDGIKKFTENFEIWPNYYNIPGLTKNKYFINNLAHLVYVV
jgi:hypothetical protein